MPQQKWWAAVAAAIMDKARTVFFIRYPILILASPSRSGHVQTPHTPRFAEMPASHFEAIIGTAVALRIDLPCQGKRCYS